MLARAVSACASAARVASSAAPVNVSARRVVARSPCARSSSLPRARPGTAREATNCVFAHDGGLQSMAAPALAGSVAQRWLNLHEVRICNCVSPARVPSGTGASLIDACSTSPRI
jgi:hypothetical protein